MPGGILREYLVLLAVAMAVVTVTDAAVSARVVITVMSKLVWLCPWSVFFISGLSSRGFGTFIVGFYQAHERGLTYVLGLQRYHCVARTIDLTRRRYGAIGASARAAIQQYTMFMNFGGRSRLYFSFFVNRLRDLRRLLLRFVIYSAR